MLKPILLAAAALWTIGLPAAAQDTAEQAAPDMADVTRDTVVASVNGTDITVGELVGTRASLLP